MWTVEQARNTYNLGRWGQGYVDVNSAGHLAIRPRPGASDAEIDLYTLTQTLHHHGLRLPVLVRFVDILDDRIDRICTAFEAACNAAGYTGRYHAVYPIKVNQQRSVVSEILSHGGDRVGLEAGSKPELMAVLGVSRPGGLIICNGYKDRAYIRLALIGRKLGHRTVIVIEKLSELELALQEAEALGMDPVLGVRVRLASLGTGKWQNSGGERSKFGLSAAQVLRLIDRLNAAGRLGTLQLLHCHLGSQVTNLRDIATGLRELATYHGELCSLGAPIETIDVGGGLGVDYEGTASRNYCSANYGIENYARIVVEALSDICTRRGLPHPDIITESGRAMTAHHALLITNVIDIEQAPGTGSLKGPEEDAPQVVHELWNILGAAEAPSVLEVHHDAVYWLKEAQTQYSKGTLTLQERIQCESIYYAICHRLRPLIKGGNRKFHDLLDELNEKLADKYFCNLSIFQSLPDVWAIDQIFPVVPLHRLDDPPTRRAVIQDLTCDSDGRIEYYVDRNGVESTLPVHPYRPGETYLLGIFLIGAYQEILGDMHNLFGDTDAVDVRLTEDGCTLSGAEHGDTADELLRYVHFDTDGLRAAYRQKIQAANLSMQEQEAFLRELEAGLSGYTYLSA
jgi:arginine decarboxylase